MGTYSAIAGGIAPSILMLPTVVLTSEGALKMVPRKMKDAALGIGCTRTQMIWKVVLPTALPSLSRGLLQAFAVIRRIPWTIALVEREITCEITSRLMPSCAPNTGNTNISPMRSGKPKGSSRE